MKHNTQSPVYDVIIVGGGASGMMAAGRAAELGARVLIIEKNKRLGKKLSITGGGRCNITNATFDNREFLDNFPKAKKFLFSSFAQFSVQDTFDLFNRLGLKIVIQERKRAFPETENAESVYRALYHWCQKGHVTFVTEEPVKKIRQHKDHWEIKTSASLYTGMSLILSTGGRAAPETGSTGDGFRWLRELGHTVAEPSPNVVPLKTPASWVHRLSGVDLSFVKMRFYCDGKQQFNKIGKILFTHFGISGPMVLNSSYDVAQLLSWGDVECSLDLYPDTELDDLDKRIVKLLDATPGKQIENSLSELMPRKIIEEILNLPQVKCAGKMSRDVTRDERRTLVHVLKDLRFPISGTMGFDRAVIADGGVDLREIDFKTMQSRIHSSLYIIGDLLNINRPSGGFSLQLCWTTGWIAGSGTVTS